MIMINSTFSSSSNWVSSILHHNKQEAENISNEEEYCSNDKVDPNGQIQHSEKAQLNVSQHKEAVTSSRNIINTTTGQLDNHLAAFLQIPCHQINITLSYSELPFFYKMAYEEQNRLLRFLLNQEGYVTDDVNKTRLPHNLINQVTDYLSRYKNDEEKELVLIKQLLIPLGEYGSGKDEVIPYARQLAIIADWLQQAVLGMSSDTWFLKQVCDIKSLEHSLFHHDNLKRRLFNQLNGHHGLAKLSSKARSYYQEQVINRIIPTFMLQPKNPHEQQRLQKMMINQPEWGYLHAGAMLLRESGAELNRMSLDDIINNGALLGTLLAEEKVPTEYSHYFKLPALIYHQLKTENKIDSVEINEQDMPSIYQNYFNDLHQVSQKNPFTQFSNLLQNWKSRPELASQQLKQHDISADWLDNYLCKNRQTEYINKNNKLVLLPNIDNVFNQQNQHIADIFKQTDRVLLPDVFNSLSKEEQAFIQQAEIHLVKAELNATSSLRDIPLSPSARQGMMASGGLVTHVPDSIDMMKCELNGEDRIYALTTKQDIGYKLHRVDYNKSSILDLFANDGKARNDGDYKLKIHSKLLLKAAKEQPQMLINKLSELHANKLFKTLHNEGYQETTRQKVETFFLSLIPFYTCITKAQKGNMGESVTAGFFDLVSFLPFLGKGLQLGGRFSVAMGEAVTQGLRTAVRQATITQALREGGKQLIKSGVPHMMKSVPPKAYTGLGIEFLRSVDPGFELLASGGIKGVNALKNAAIKTKQKINGLIPLAEALEKQAKALSVTPVESFKTERAFRPELAKEVQVVNIGQERGKDIWVQVNPVTGVLFGRKYLRDTAGNLELAPVQIRERLYQLSTQGMSGRGAERMAQNWTNKSISFSDKTSTSKMNKLKEKLERDQINIKIDLFNKNSNLINFDNISSSLPSLVSPWSDKEIFGLFVRNKSLSKHDALLCMRPSALKKNNHVRYELFEKNLKNLLTISEAAVLNMSKMTDAELIKNFGEKMNFRLTENGAKKLRDNIKKLHVGVRVSVNEMNDRFIFIHTHSDKLTEPTMYETIIKRVFIKDEFFETAPALSHFSLLHEIFHVLGGEDFVYLHALRNLEKKNYDYIKSLNVNDSIREYLQIVNERFKAEGCSLKPLDDIIRVLGFDETSPHDIVLKTFEEKIVSGELNINNVVLDSPDTIAIYMIMLSGAEKKIKLTFRKTVNALPLADTSLLRVNPENRRSFYKDFIKNEFYDKENLMLEMPDTSKVIVE